MARFPKACLVLTALMLAAGRSSAEQQMPSCAELNKLWVSTYRAALKPTWPANDLACSKTDRQLTAEDIRDIDMARAAHFLSATVWTRGGALMFHEPLVEGGGISAPPNMLRWVARRVKGVEYDVNTPWAFSDAPKGIVHLTPGDFKLEPGAGLASQLIHESRHIGITPYGHEVCAIPGVEAKTNCDPTIAEDFSGGGSHAIAAIWLVWIANRSNWPLAVRSSAVTTVKMVLTQRINDTHAADQFACRYLGYYVWNTRAKCL